MVKLLGNKTYWTTLIARAGDMFSFQIWILIQGFGLKKVTGIWETGPRFLSGDRKRTGPGFTKEGRADGESHLRAPSCTKDFFGTIWDTTSWLSSAAVNRPSHDLFQFRNSVPCVSRKKKEFEHLHKEYRIAVNRMAPDDVFLLLINPPNKNKPVQKLIAKYVFDCYEKRRSLVL